MTERWWIGWREIGVRVRFLQHPPKVSIQPVSHKTEQASRHRNNRKRKNTLLSIRGTHYHGHGAWDYSIRFTHTTEDKVLAVVCSVKLLDWEIDKMYVSADVPCRRNEHYKFNTHPGRLALCVDWSSFSFSRAPHKRSSSSSRCLCTVASNMSRFSVFLWKQ